MAEIKINIKNSTIKCPHCGAKNSENNEFCLKCGNKLKSNQYRPEGKSCPHCGFKNRIGTSFCAKCGKSLSKPKKKRQKRKLAKKIYKTSKLIFKSSKSRNFRNKTINHVLDEVEDLKQRNFIKIDKTLRELNKNKTSNGYLLCDSCPVYYKIDKKVSRDNKKTCACGGKLIYSDRPRYSD
ncbi:MAG: zinc-ribbon domain-containing protein [Methanobacteriaceae archaeon]|nr:zinc-ribbon domain-containing protein [Methanobacteriaceae archaeon]MDP2835856.1 zinc-ribbon domain-containing protein [Methanobacteriaceae archaeon]MDP3034659.1 zinc-ribbon domain-containing protein [Methanobacteriaceae archaeon]MDP3485624.1 zinc-ribbon domain-containing protein [Methanobacteriaceae archaeon]